MIVQFSLELSEVILSLPEPPEAGKLQIHCSIMGHERSVRRANDQANCHRSISPSLLRNGQVYRGCK